MITIETLKTIISEYKNPDKINLISRDKKLALKSNNIIVVSGVRRCGKSTMFRFSLKDEKHKIFINFEDTRLVDFEINDFLKIENIANELNVNYLVFDEIQNIEGWEKYIRSAHDKAYEIYITGSNASLLSRELGSKLTGRYIQTELFPFNYSEYLKFNKLKSSRINFQEYLFSGGFPEFLQSKESEYLRTLFRDIVIRDIAVRRNIKNEQTLLSLALHLVSNVGKEISYNKMSQVLKIKSVRTTIDYCDFLKESYLFDFIPRFSFSIKQQLINPKKVYSIDTGMAKANSLSFSEDLGRMLENAVFMHLRQNNSDILYYKNKTSECDFLVRKNDKILQAIKVCWQITEDNLKREIEGLKNAMTETKAQNGIIITHNQEDEFDGIKVIPAWKWMQKNYR
jgi:predicted AAA+ superfamily ATPase